MRPRNPSPNEFHSGELRKRLTQYGQKLIKGAPRGTDIHIYSETRNSVIWLADKAASYSEEAENGEDYIWIQMEEAEGSNRDYWFFGLLAGVRTEWPFGFQTKGSPDDASEQVSNLLQSWESDGHSHSWLTRAELKAKRNELFLLRGENLINPSLEYGAQHLDHLIGKLDDQVQYLTGLSPDAADEDQRIVFWFDN